MEVDSWVIYHSYKIVALYEPYQNSYQDKEAICRT
jgi:hypothetical protein